MEELYRIIEQKIKDAGYPRAISGEMVYGDICDQIEGKEIFDEAGKQPKREMGDINKTRLTLVSIRVKHMKCKEERKMPLTE